MYRKELLQKIAPCSLICHTCAGYDNGIICESAKTLLTYLEGIKEFYRKHDPDTVKMYNCFEEMLGMYCAAPCSGCRSAVPNKCSIKGCFILECTTGHGVDFCGECNEFPCEKVSGLFEKEVYTRWLNGNRHIHENGIEAFWEKNSEIPHYQAYLPNQQ